MLQLARPYVRKQEELTGRGRMHDATFPLPSSHLALDKRNKAAACTHSLCHPEVVGELPERQHHKRPPVCRFLGKKTVSAVRAGLSILGCLQGCHGKQSTSLLHRAILQQSMEEQHLHAQLWRQAEQDKKHLNTLSSPMKASAFSLQEYVVSVHRTAV